VWVDDRFDGEIGARFVVELPIVEQPFDPAPGAVAESVPLT
jgi:hypothetical protein